MEAGTAAAAGPQVLSVSFEGPYATAFKWLAFAIGWPIVFNASVVFATYGFVGAFEHWYELLFFPITVIYRHASRGIVALAGKVMPKKCNAIQRALLGGNYCSRVETAADRVEQLKKKGVTFEAHPC